MSDVVIRVENLSKHYRLGQISGGTLREDLQRWWAGVRGKENPLQKVDAKPISGTGEHWALQDVSFEVRQGEVLGIIGRNGAGKSTLLKILSRTTAPTKGSVRIKGRVGSLLEVGTGFHPELSGRENIYLNGTILGMRKAEIDRKLDEIIAFSGVEKFIDTPVKRYSSGMYVRLAFAVAAHLEPEILIVDEVLAVGDAEFQRKCLGKMRDVSKQGRTVLFVSHNIAAISQLCTQCLLLHDGRVMQHGAVDGVVDFYVDQNNVTGDRRDWPGGVGAEIKLFSAELVDFNNRPKGVFSTAEDVSIIVKYTVSSKINGAKIAIRLSTPDGIIVLTSEDGDATNKHNTKYVGDYVARIVIQRNLLAVGRYFITIAAHIPMVEMIFFEENAICFEVQNLSENNFVNDGRKGVINPKLEWYVSPVTEFNSCVSFQ
jgi:lipopolysaccharide transport system ATP-binding protein